MTEIVRSAARVLDLLEYFAGIEGDATLAAVTEAMEMPKTTVLALLKTLCARGYLLRDGRGLYSLNEIFASQGFGWASSRLVRLLSAADPILQKFAEQVGETALLGALTPDGQVKVLVQTLTTQPIRYQTDVGRTVPVYCTAMGRILLSESLIDERNALLAKHPIGSFTTSTLTDPAKIHEQMDIARDQGYCVVVDEYDNGGTGIAAALRDGHGKIFAALNFACVSARFASKQDTLKLLLKKAVLELEASVKKPSETAPIGHSDS
ncbi:IclR family transcriptional regulator [Variovorax sp. 2RAF20]